MKRHGLSAFSVLFFSLFTQLRSDSEEHPMSSNMQDETASVLAMAVTMMALPTLAVALRFWARVLSSSKNHSRSTFWWDDWTALAALILTLIPNGVALDNLKLGLGQHTAAVDPSDKDLSSISYSFFSGVFTFYTATTLAKNSIVFLYQRVFDIGDRKFRITCYAVHFVLIAQWLGVSLSLVFMCIPIEKTFKPWIEGQCRSMESIWVVGSVPNIVLNLVVIVLPLPKLWRLHTRLASKILLTGIFILASSQIVVAIATPIVVLKLSTTAATDPIWYATVVFLWLSPCTSIGVICVCLPSFIVFKNHVKMSALLRILGLHGLLGGDRRLEKEDESPQQLQQPQYLQEDRHRPVIAKVVTTTIDIHTEHQLQVFGV